MRLGIRQLEMLRLFSKTRSVTETARLMRVSQPAMSQTIKDIEGQLGFAIMLRAGNKSRLTDEARAILPEVEGVLAQMSHLVGHAEELRDARAGSLSLAAVPSLFLEILPAAITSFLAEHGKVRVKAEVQPAREIVRAVQHDAAHLGFAFLPVDEAAVAVQPLLEMNAVCVVPAASLLAQKPVIHARDLRDELVIIQDVHSPAGLAINEGIETELSGSRILRVNQSVAAVRFVAQGIGIAIVHPISMSGRNSDGAEAVPFEPAVPMTLGLIYSRQKKLSRVFYELAAASPIATEALARIAALYRIEAEIRGRPADDRRAVRQERSRPVIEALELWLREKLGLVSRKSKLADAIRYALSRC